MTERKSLADKIANARARMQLLGIEPITTRVWVPAISHVAPKAAAKPVELPRSVTKIRRSA